MGPRGRQADIAAAVGHPDQAGVAVARMGNSGGAAAPANRIAATSALAATRSARRVVRSLIAAIPVQGAEDVNACAAVHICKCFQ